jgi:hypothetical protein
VPGLDGAGLLVEIATVPRCRQVLADQDARPEIAPLGEPDDLARLGGGDVERDG